MSDRSKQVIDNAIVGDGRQEGTLNVVVDDDASGKLTEEVAGQVRLGWLCKRTAAKKCRQGVLVGLETSAVEKPEHALRSGNVRRARVGTRVEYLQN